MENKQQVQQTILDAGEEIPVPTMNVNLAKKDESAETPALIADKQLLDMFKEIVDTVKSDKKELDEAISVFGNMVMNDGDSTSATKEAYVNLLKMKADQSDKLTKVADLMTRIKMKERDTFPKYLAQNNTINVGGSGNNRRSLLEALNKAKEQRKEEGTHEQ